MWPVLVVLVVGALDMWRRGTSFHWGTYGGAVGALAGAVALAIAWVVTGGWAEDRDPVALLALAVATELALRGWLVERIYRGGVVARHRSRTAPDDAAGSWTHPSETRAVLAVLVGAIAEALVTPGGVTARIGAAAFGAGLGWMYVRAGLMAPVAARLVFVLGGLALQLPW